MTKEGAKPRAVSRCEREIGEEIGEAGFPTKGVTRAVVEELRPLHLGVLHSGEIIPSEGELVLDENPAGLLKLVRESGKS